MKKIVIGLLIIAAASMLVYQFVVKKEFKEEQEDLNKPLVSKPGSSAFTSSYDTLLQSYYTLKDALADNNDSQANAAAAALKTAADSLRMNELGDDSTGLIRETATSYAGSISTSADALQQETSLEEKRKEFEVISDALWSLTRTVQYSGGMVYYVFCPEAFDNKGAYWLSNSADLKNPYSGENSSCGVIKDSLSYGK